MGEKSQVKLFHSFAGRVSPVEVLLVTKLLKAGEPPSSKEDIIKMRVGPSISEAPRQ